MTGLWLLLTLVSSVAACQADYQGLFWGRNLLATITLVSLGAALFFSLR